MNDDFLLALYSQLQQQSWLEVIAVGASVLYPWLAARENILCWPLALISTSLYVYIFWEVNLPFNSVLNAYYLGMAVYGWILWSKKKSQPALAIRMYPILYHLIAIPTLLILGFVLTHLATFSWQGSDLYLDAMVTIFSVYATYLMANKILENWLYWLVINSFATYLYLSHNLLLTGMLFVVYFGLAIYGYWRWRKEYLSYIETASPRLM